MRKLNFLCLLLILFITSSIVGQSEGETGFVSWHPSGNMIAVAYDSAVNIIDVASGDILNSFEITRTDALPIWSPSGNELAFAKNNDVEVWSQPWDPLEATLITTYRYYPPETPLALLSSIDAMVWSPDGTKIASAAGSRVDIWDISSGELLLLLPIGEIVWDIVPDLAWSNDNRIAISNLNGVVMTVDGDTGAPLSAFRHVSSTINTEAISAVDFDPNEDLLVVGTSSGMIKIWGDTRTDGILTENATLVYGKHPSPVVTVDWSPSGQSIASSGYDGSIRIWDAATGEDLQVIDMGSDVLVNSVAWSPDGRQLAYTDIEGKVIIIPSPEGDSMLTPTPVDD